MKISKLQKFAGVFFTLVLGTSALSAQGWRNWDRAFVQNNERITCVNYISGLSDDQVKAITGLETKHQEQMDVLRDKRRATVNWEEKDLIREEMLENVVAHRDEVRKLLNGDQQKEYDLLQLRGNNFRNQRVGYGYAQGRGYGNGQGYVRGNRGCYRGAGCRRGNIQNYRNSPQFN